MRLTVLGCSGTFPSADSPCSSYLVRHDGFTLMVDAGNGAIGALQRETGLLDVDAVLLSHLHADHCVDLVAYSYARRFHPEHPPLLPVYGPAGTADRLGAIVGDPRGLEKAYEFHTVTRGKLEIGPFQVELARTAHPVECYAMRIAAGGRTLAYSADTGPSDNVVEVARGADLFLCESTWLDGAGHPKAVHMTAREAGEHAARAGAGRLLLIHTTAYLDDMRFLAEAGEEYDGPLALARAGTTYDV